MTLFASLGRAQLKNSYTISTGSESPSNQLQGDNSAGLISGPWQSTGAVSEGGPAHPDDTTLSEEHFNRDGGLEVPGCWTTVIRRQGGAILTDL